jgi:hypothetical protein
VHAGEASEYFRSKNPGNSPGESPKANEILLLNCMPSRASGTTDGNEHFKELYNDFE